MSRRRIVWTAADWPFYRAGVNPVAADTPPELVALAERWLDAGAVGGLSVHTTGAALKHALEGRYRNKWHRVRDVLVGLWDDATGRSDVRTTAAWGRR